MNKSNISEDDAAVSPVIGVILMVAITVILAAVIAAFVLDLGQSQSANVNAGISVDENSDELRVSWTSEGTADGLDVQVEITDSGSTAGTLTESANPSSLGSVGESSSITVSSGDTTDSGKEVEVYVDIIATSGNDESVISSSSYTIEVQ